MVFNRTMLRRIFGTRPKKIAALPVPTLDAKYQYENANAPFFIVGSVRSGTTMLRDLLRHHPRLECPEETHFFRWGDAYGSKHYHGRYVQNKVLRKQQDMDGVSEEEFNELIGKASTKGELAHLYGQLYLHKHGKPEGRWFDKTPQNVYGMLLINTQYPNSKFVHIYRNPLNVISSLLQGKVIPAQSMVGAINFWLEAFQVIDQYKQAWDDRIIEISYEKVTSNVETELGALLEQLGEDPTLLNLPANCVHPEKNKYKKILTPEQIDFIKEACEPYYSDYGFN